VRFISRTHIGLSTVLIIAGTGICPSPLALLASTSSSIAGVRAQEAQGTSATAISKKVNVVSFLATVHDRDGAVVQNLTPDDFVLLEDGVPQKIAYFSQESDLPLTVGLLVDTSRSQKAVLEQERVASYTFLDQVLRADKDQAFIEHFDTRAEVLQGLTSSRDELDAALRKLRIPRQPATLIFTAVHDSSEDVMRQQPGRKALILLTDGVAFREHTSIGTAIEFAQRADTIIYAIRFSDPLKYQPLEAALSSVAKERGRLGLHRMADETGGISYGVGKNQPIETIYAQIEDLLRNQYSIGYTPERANFDDGKYHKVKLTTKNRQLVVHTRDGYYAH
jgi:VWFA-related protein